MRVIKQKTKKEVYRDILRNLIKTNSIPRSTRGLMSEKGGRLFIQKLESYGYVNFEYEHNLKKVVSLTDKGQQLFNQLNDFKFEFKEREVFK